MTRYTPAAKQLIEQATAINNKTKAIPYGEVDGFGIHRSVQFDAATSKWLSPLLEALGDARIAEVSYEGKGRAVVTFVADTRADRRTHYPLEEVKAILTDPEESEAQ